MQPGGDYAVVQAPRSPSSPRSRRISLAEQAGRAHASAKQTHASQALLRTRRLGERELDFPYYSLADGFTSTLNLVSDSPQPLDFLLSVHSRSGQTLVAPKMTIESQAKLPIDMAGLLKSLNVDITGDFSEGSVSLNFVGTIMPLVGQMTSTNPALRLVHESEMVENDPGRTDIPQVLNGLWWNIAGGRDAQVMVTNMSPLSASADVFLDFAGTRHPSAALTFKPHESKTVSVVQLLADLNVAPSQAPEGGITIIQREFTPTLIAQGKVLDPASGFSTTLSFPDPARERANSLHASGVPIGKPTLDSPFARSGYFVPHVVLRNLTGAAQAVTITVEYPKGSAWNSAGAPGGPAIPTVDAVAAVSSPTTNKTNRNGGGDEAATISPADLTGQLSLAPLPVGPYSTADFSLDAVMGQLPLPLPYCSIRIQYSGAPGSTVAQVSSVDVRRDMVINATVANEGDGWHGSGANPWHLDKETESILFLTDESDKPAAIAFSVTARGIHYYLTRLELAPHETRAIDLRKLRDAQQPDFDGNKIPAEATDGSVSWNRLDNEAVSGRLVVLRRHGGVASSYDCCPCPCPDTLLSVTVRPSTATIRAGNTQQYTFVVNYITCNGNIGHGQQLLPTWSSSDTTVATMSGATATGQGGGTATITATVYGCVDYLYGERGQCTCDFQDYAYGYASLTVTPTISSISPTYATVGSNNVELYIKGNGFGSSPTVNLPSGFTPTGQHAITNTQIIYWVNISVDTTIASDNISVTAGGQTTNNVSFIADGPSYMKVVYDSMVGQTRETQYQVFSLSTYLTGLIYIGENETTSGYNCTQQPPPNIDYTHCGDKYTTPLNAQPPSIFIDSWSFPP